MRVGNFGFIPVFTHRMKNKQSSTKDLGPFRLVLVYEPIICLLWNLEEALLTATI